MSEFDYIFKTPITRSQPLTDDQYKFFEEYRPLSLWEISKLQLTEVERKHLYSAILQSRYTHCMIFALIRNPMFYRVKYANNWGINKDLVLEEIIKIKTY